MSPERQVRLALDVKALADRCYAVAADVDGDVDSTIVNAVVALYQAARSLGNLATLLGESALKRGGQ